MKVTVVLFMPLYSIPRGPAKDLFGTQMPVYGKAKPLTAFQVQALWFCAEPSDLTSATVNASIILPFPLNHNHNPRADALETQQRVISSCMRRPRTRGKYLLGSCSHSLCLRNLSSFPGTLLLDAYFY